MPDADHENGAGSARLTSAPVHPAKEGRPRSHTRAGTALVIVAFVGALILLDVVRSRFLSDPVLRPHPSPVEVPTLRFQDESGRELALSDFSGRIVLLNVWATWCPPCRYEMPSLDELQQTLGGADFEVVAIATDPTGVTAVRPFFERLEIRSLAIYVDRRGAVVPELRVAGLPTTLLIGRDGREIGRSTGPADWNSDGARTLIRRHLQARPSSRPGA